MNKTKFKFTTSRTITFMILSIILILPLIIFYKDIQSNINGTGYSDIKGNLICYYLDVGQSDCTIIILPDNKVMIIDSGSPTYKDKLSEALENILGNKKIIDYLVLTHSDNDHSGNMSYIFNEFDVRNFYRPKQFIPGYEEINYSLYNNYNLINAYENIEYYSCIIAMQKEENLNVFFNEKGTKIVGENYSFEFLSPIENSYNNVNNYSPVILLEYNDFKFMFTGDVLEKGELEAISHYPKNDINFLKIAHHGSKTSSSLDFLNHFTPTYAIISCGKDNLYGFPNEQVIYNLIYAGTKDENILKTSESGTIVVSIENENYKISFITEHFIIKTLYLFPVIILICFALCYINFSKNNDDEE